MKCLKMSKKKFDQNEGWDCPICDWRKEPPRSSTRPGLNELKDWANSAETLQFLPEELPIVNKIITLAETWVNSIQPILRGVETQSIDDCRFYLRKIEGAEIFLPNEYNFFRRAAHTLAPVTSTPPPMIVQSKAIKRPRPKKPKQEISELAQQRDTQVPHFSALSIHEHNPLEQRILPAQRIEQRMESRTAFNDHIPTQPYQPAYMSYSPHSMVTLPPLPRKGIFAPPQVPISPYRPEEHGSAVGRIPSFCASCNSTFIPGMHNEPVSCTQCQRLHHTVCIGKYGGRLYPAFVW